MGYGAVLFSEPSYQGECSWVIDYVSDLTKSNGAQNNPVIDKVSSVFVFRYKTNQLNGQPLTGEPGQEVTFYNAANCQTRGATWDNTMKKIKPGNCEYNKFFETGNLKDDCNSMQSILSIKMTEKSLVLLRAPNGHCQLFLKNGETSCISTVKYGYVYSPIDLSLKPTSFTLFPFDTIQSAK
jgi:hypothetical protein